MNKRKTVGERLMRKHFDATFDGDAEILSAASDIDRAIRRAQAKAWEDGYDACFSREFGIQMEVMNPYRGRAKR